MKRLLILALVSGLCLVAAGCGEEKPAPDELQTPQYSVTEEPTPADVPEPEESEIHKASDGVKVIAPESETGKSAKDEQEAASAASAPVQQPSAAAAAPVTPDTVWEEDAVVTYNAFTLPEKAAFDNGSIGMLSIDKIGLAVNVYESSDQMEDMEKGLAHFKSTSAWDGNVALSGHNSTASGYGAYFRDLHQLGEGDSIRYRTALGEREYVVASVGTIDETDWSGLGRTAENRLSLITCVNDNPAKRLLVSAVQA